MEKKCSRCGKIFNPNDKSIKSVDADGNPLRIDLCSMCELDNAVEEVMKFKHINRKEAEKYIFNTMNEALGSAVINKKSITSITSNRIKKRSFKHYTSNKIIPNAIVKVVDINEVCSN